MQISAPSRDLDEADREFLRSLTLCCACCPVVPRVRRPMSPAGIGTFLLLCWGDRQRELARAWSWESRIAPFSAEQPITAAGPNQRRKFHVSGEVGFGPRMRYIVCSHKRTGRRYAHTLHGRMCHPAKGARICDAPFHHPLGHSATNGTVGDVASWAQALQARGSGFS